MAATEEKPKENILGELEEQLTDINKTALLIAYERWLETQREDALFQDPLAERLKGVSGKKVSDEFQLKCTLFEFPDWPEFHICWTAVRTKFIDEWFKKEIARLKEQNVETVQIVNIGAGVDSRPSRLECMKGTHVWECDMAAINAIKENILEKLGAACIPEKRTSVDADFNENTLENALAEKGYNKELPTLWLAEGLLMYLGVPRQKEFLTLLSSLSAPGSGACLNFLQSIPEYTLQDHELIAVTFSFSLQL